MKNASGKESLIVEINSEMSDRAFINSDSLPVLGIKTEIKKKGDLFSKLIFTLAKWEEVGLQGVKMRSKDEFHRMAALP